MDKQAFEIDPEIVKRYAIGGALTGGSAAALINLVRMIRQMNEDRKAKQEPSETDENTIVLTLPRKTAEVKAEKKEPTRVKKVEVTKVALTSGPKSQTRRCDGTIGIKTASNWQTLTAAVLAAMGSAAAGGAVVNRIYDYRRQKQLEDDLEAAKQEYLDALQGQGKMAEALDSFFSYPGMDKDAQEGGRVFGTLSYPIAAAALLTILGTGGTAYLTKKILDEKLRAATEKKLDMPKIKRIVFRSAPEESEEEDEELKVAEAEVDAIRASLGVMLDKVGYETKVLETGYVKEAMAKAGTSTIKLLKMAQDIDALKDYLADNPELRELIQRATMEKHPVLRYFKWGLKLPGVGRIADRKLMERFEDTFQAAPTAKETLIGLNPVHKTPYGHYFGRRGAELAKEGQISTGSILASTIGSTLADNASEERLADALVNAQQRAKKEEAKELSPEEIAQKIELASTDEDAAEYIAQNRERILAILQEMAEADQLKA